MKKGYYIHFEGSKLVGVYKKIQMQLRILNKYSICSEIEIDAGQRTILSRISSLFPWGVIPWNYDVALQKINEPDYIYIRRVNADKGLIGFLSELKSQFPKCKLILEIPTYPYDAQSFNTLLLKPFRFRDRKYRVKYREFFDRIIVYADEVNVFGVDTISVSNGVLFDSIQYTGHTENGVIDLLAVASFQGDHGYERVLYGLYRYIISNGKRKFMIHLVGKGDELSKYKSLVDSLHLEEYVKIYGEKRGAELDKIYSVADFGLGCFGLYKSGLTHISSLKSCEYLAHGLPVISGCVEDIWKNAKETAYLLEYSNDSSVIDFERIVLFYDSVYSGEIDAIDVQQRVRDFGRLIADMEKNYQKVIDYVVTI